MNQLGLLLLAALAPQMEYPAPLIREEQQVMVDGHNETWRLQWAAEPKPACEPNEVSLTCPCMGFAYGETGDLSVVRLRDGIEIDRLRLAPLFHGEQPEPTVQRWAPDSSKDFDLALHGDLPAAASRWLTVQVMHFTDFNHDGRKTEFYLQTDTLPCGKSIGVVIGVTPDHPTLHAFGTVSSLNEPLVLHKREWDALERASGPIDVMDWPCGDHGSDTETRVQLRWTTSGISGTRRQYSCPDSGQKKRLLSEERL